MGSYDRNSFLQEYSVLSEDRIPSLINEKGATVPCKMAFLKVAQMLGYEKVTHSPRDYWMTDIYTRAILSAQKKWKVPKAKIVDILAHVNFMMKKIIETDETLEDVFCDLRTMLTKGYDTGEGEEPADNLSPEATCHLSTFLYDIFGSSFAWKVIRHAFKLPKEIDVVYPFTMLVPRVTIPLPPMPAPYPSMGSAKKAKSPQFGQILVIPPREEDSKLLPVLREAVSDDYLANSMIPSSPIPIPPPPGKGKKPPPAAAPAPKKGKK